MQQEVVEGDAPRRPEAVDEDQIADLVKENLTERLAIIPEPELAQALHDYVDKVLFHISQFILNSMSSTPSMSSTFPL